MIVVSVDLVSAISPDRSTRLALMHIANDGQATIQNPRLGDYLGETFVGRDAASLATGRVSKRAAVRGWRRHDYHVWNLVRRMLEAMGYDKGAPARFAAADLPLLDPEDPDVVSLAGLTPDQRADIVAHIAGLTEDHEAYPAPEGGWHCFHCGAHLRTVRGARLHFGPTPDGVARCVEAAA